MPEKVPILQGPLKGAAWLRASGTAGCWLGSYETAKQQAIAGALSKGQTFYDIGAHAGFYSLLAGRMVGPSGNVVAFEPDPRNLANLRRHVALNQLTNVRIIAAAVGATTGTVRMSFAASSYENQLSAEGSHSVECLALDEAVSRLRLPLPHCIKIDTEGAEESVLMGAMDTLKRANPTVFLATHSPELHDRCARLLRSIGYLITSVDGTPWHASEELLAVRAP